jgi:hypothetical protein
MRISVDIGDAGHRFDTYGVRIFLDGQEVSHCVTADEEQGLVVRLKIGEDGRRVICPDTLETERYEQRGVVRILMPKVTT